MKILVAAMGDVRSDPRPNRMVRWLAERHEVWVFGNGGAPPEAAGFIPLDRSPYRLFEHDDRVATKLVRLLRARLGGNDRQLLLGPAGDWLPERLDRLRFDLIVCHDLHLLPLAGDLRPRVPVLFDAREYYPRQFEDRLLWKIVFGGMNRRLCREHLSRVDAGVTVSPGIAAAYRARYGVAMDVILSLPDAVDLRPAAVDAGRIRLVHHGAANPSRQIERMVRMTDHLDRRFSLDLMLVGEQDEYRRRIGEMVASRPRVRLIPPQPLHGIVPFLNGYDLGVYLLPPRSFNQRHALPNKFFEFVQARLGVCIGPSPEMAAIARRHGFGLVSPDFSARSMAGLLNRLTAGEVDDLKRNADAAARLLCAEANRDVVLDLVERTAAGPAGGARR